MLAGVLFLGPAFAFAQERAVDGGANAAPDKQACIDATEQGQTLRDDGHVRSARDAFLTCASDTCPKIIIQSCTKWLRELDESAPTLVLAAKDAEGDDVTDATVTFDGAVFATTLDGRALVADVGEHVLRFERPGATPVEQKLLIRAGEKARLVSVILRGPEAPHVGATEARPRAEEVRARPEAPLSTHHVVAGTFALGALASAGLAIAFVLQANQHASDADDIRARNGLSATIATDPISHTCSSSPSHSGCAELGNVVNQQYRDTNLAIGFFVGTGALVAGSLAAWVLWPRADPATPSAKTWVAPERGGATLHVVGSF